MLTLVFSPEFTPCTDWSQVSQRQLLTLTSSPNEALHSLLVFLFVLTLWIRIGTFVAFVDPAAFVSAAEMRFESKAWDLYIFLSFSEPSELGVTDAHMGAWIVKTIFDCCPGELVLRCEYTPVCGSNRRSSIASLMTVFCAFLCLPQMKLRPSKNFANIDYDKSSRIYVEIRMDADRLRHKFTSALHIYSDHTSFWV